jgi:uncharacterized membrane protein YhhN
MSARNFQTEIEEAFSAARRIMPVIVLILIAFISAALEIRAEYKGPAIQIYLCKPLTLLCIILIALEGRQQSTLFYQSMIVAGLSCSLIGDIFLMLPSDRFIQGLVSFLLAHLCYIAAFFTGFTGATKVSALASLILFVLYAGLMMRVLLPHLKGLKIPVLVYMLLIMLMGWQALLRSSSAGSAGSKLAFAGALLFIASDSILALNRFKRSFKSAQFLILSTYFIAQTLIALSV